MRFASCINFNNIYETVAQNFSNLCAIPHYNFIFHSELYNDIIDFHELFVEKGVDSVNLIVNHVTEDLIRKDISAVSRPGDRSWMQLQIRRKDKPECFSESEPWKGINKCGSAVWWWYWFHFKSRLRTEKEKAWLYHQSHWPKSNLLHENYANFL